MARSTESATARERARQMQADQAKKDKRASLLLPVIVVVLAVVLVAGMIFWAVSRDGDEVAFTEDRLRPSRTSTAGSPDLLHRDRRGRGPRHRGR